MIRYHSTRGAAGSRTFEDVLLAGLAEDGGLFVPETWPSLPSSRFRELRGADYATLSAELLEPFTADCFTREDLNRLSREAYASFTHEAIAPLRQLGRDHWLLELFHGPTLAFKDCAMQLLALMFDEVLKRRGQKITIVGATSGDTGAAAVRAFAGKDQVRLAMLHPSGRVSAVQERQMTTVMEDNVLNIAIDGTFDDCQDLVKAMFADETFRRDMRLSAVNSINWARVVAQSVYYVYAALRLGAPDRPVAFAVPTGNFGNVFAGRVASKLGLPIEKLVVATNENDILARFFATGAYARGQVSATTSPSMDIQVASNFERLLLEFEGDDPARTAAAMQHFKREGAVEIERGRFEPAAGMFVGGRADREEVARAIRRTLERTGALVDPHTGVALAVLERAEQPPDRTPELPTDRPPDLPPGLPVVTLATAHPAKFPDAVEAACGVRPGLPAPWTDLMERPTRALHLANDLATVEHAIHDHFGTA